MKNVPCLPALHCIWQALPAGPAHCPCGTLGPDPHLCTGCQFPAWHPVAMCPGRCSPWGGGGIGHRVLCRECTGVRTLPCGHVLQPTGTPCATLPAPLVAPYGCMPHSPPQCWKHPPTAGECFWHGGTGHVAAECHMGKRHTRHRQSLLLVAHGVG